MLSSWLSANWIMYRKALAFGRLLRLPCSRLVQAAPGLKKITAFFVMLFQLCGALVFDWPTTPDGPMIDMDQFYLEWSDECNGSALDTDRWGGVWGWDPSGPHSIDNAYVDPGQIRFDGDNMIITTEWKDSGKHGPGYYTCCLVTRWDYTAGRIGYEQTYGYFEIRCVLPKGDGINTAFWLLSNGMFENKPSGVGGSEIDVFETRTNPSGKDKRWKDSIYQTIHVGGYNNPNHKNQMVGHFYVPNPTQEFNTYGVAWNESEYIWYINGQETARTSFAGPCQAPMYLLLSVQVDENIQYNEDLPVEFIVDYVRAYQYK